MTIETKNIYTTTDGKTFDTMDAAVDHEEWLVLKEIAAMMQSSASSMHIPIIASKIRDAVDAINSVPDNIKHMEAL